jgi:hypothetical protein
MILYSNAMSSHSSYRYKTGSVALMDEYSLKASFFLQSAEENVETIKYEVTGQRRKLQKEFHNLYSSHTIMVMIGEVCITHREMANGGIVLVGKPCKDTTLKKYKHKAGDIAEL